MKQPPMRTEDWQTLLEKVTSSWDRSQATVVDKPAVFVNNWKIFALWFQAYDTKWGIIFFRILYFLKKEIVQRGQSYQFHALTLKSCVMFKRGLNWKRCPFFFWGLLISVVILTSFSNYSRRFYLYLYFFMTFHDLLLVSNETTNLACCTVNTLFTLSLSFYSFCFSVLGQKEVLPFLSSVISLLSIRFPCCNCSCQSRCWPTQHKVKHII